MEKVFLAVFEYGVITLLFIPGSSVSLSKESQVVIRKVAAIELKNSINNTPSYLRHPLS